MKAIALTSALVLASCSTPAHPPSLMPRAIESRDDTVAPPPSPPPMAQAPNDADIIARLATLVDRARAGDRTFQVAVADVAALQKGLRAPEASETWIAAETRLSAIERARQDSASALAELDAVLLASETMAADGKGTASELAIVRAAWTEADQIVSAQNEVLGRLKN